MDKLQDLFFELIRISIGASDCMSKTPTNEEWPMLYEMAKKQSIVGVCFAGVYRLRLQKQGPESPLYFTWMGMAAKIQQLNEEKNQQCAKLTEHFQDVGFRTCILKGQGTAALYGELANLRQSGDIDAWVMPRETRTIKESRARIDELVHKSFPDETGKFLHINYPLFPNTEVEVHYVPTMDGNPLVDKRFVQIFEDRQDACFGNQTDLGFSVLEPTLNVVFNLHHIMRHFINEGIGMRHVMDLYFLLGALNRKDLNNHNSILSTMRGLGMQRFTSGLMWILKDVFGMSEELLLCEPNEKRGRVLLHEIMRGGNFGHDDERLKGVHKMSFGKRWVLYIKVSQVRFRYFPVATFWSWMFRVKVGFWRRFGVGGID